jgi:hypothetical protein
MEKRLLRSGDRAPVSGNYQFVRHEAEAEDCVPRIGAYVHLRKGMKIPLHDDCLQPAVWSLMTVTEEDEHKKIKGM